MNRHRFLIRRFISRTGCGFTVIEVTLVLTILGLAAVGASLSLAQGLRHQEARGAAQACQAAAGGAQVGVLWNGGSARVSYVRGVMSISYRESSLGDEVGQVAPNVATTSNVARWLEAGGISVGFSGMLASPDGGGSLYFFASEGAYRLVVRPGSGLTARSWATTF